MKKIFVIGAGRSSSSLIKYLLDHSSKENWSITIADADVQLAQQKTAGYSNTIAISFDVNNDHQRHQEIDQADIVVSLLPPSLHIIVAKDCLKFKKHLVTASYVTKEMEALNDEAKQNDLIFLNEIGLDPGIDHMSAMKIIDKVKSEGGEFISFKSYCGGLIAPESNDNPWGYKFTWNPRNVILAGQGGAKYIENGKEKELCYEDIFWHIEKVNIEGLGVFDGYLNRDSLSYHKPYGLESIPTMLRGTLRASGFCIGWSVFAEAGLTDDTIKIPDSNTLSYRQFFDRMVESRGYTLYDDMLDEIKLKIESTGILSNEKITLVNATPAQILQDLLERKWKLKEHDKDMIVMQHEFVYKEKIGTQKKLISNLVVKGEDQTYTAMAKTVGLPMAIAVKLIATDLIKSRGVIIPITKEFYEPVLSELSVLGINFKETIQ